MPRLPITLLILAFSSLGNAAIFTVDTSADTALMACTAAPNDCSLRGAIMMANVTSGGDTVAFDIPPGDSGFITASGHWRISIGSELPFVDDNVVIDGYSQPGASENTLTPAQGGSNAVLKIEVQNAGVASTQGIRSTGNNFFSTLVVRGLAINRFSSQIVLSGGAAHRVEGCFLGTTIDGAAPSTSSNPGRGIFLQGQGASVIGGLAPAARNLLSGLNDGLTSLGTPSGLRVEGNLFGTSAAGSALLGNRGDAISLAGAPNLSLGGPTAAARNVIAGSGFSAIRLGGAGGAQSLYVGARVQGNFIGTDLSGTLAFGNGFNPSSPSQVLPSILIGGLLATGLEIGGEAAGAANLIAHSAAAGVTVDQAQGVLISSNVFRSNRGIAIDNVLGGAAVGPTPNDADDPDLGGNRLQNYPQVTAIAMPDANTVRLSYRVDSAPANATYPLRVRFFRGVVAQAVELVATREIALAQAQAEQTIDLPLSAFADQWLVATATDTNGNTSEFATFGFGEVFSDGFEP